MVEDRRCGLAIDQLPVDLVGHDAHTVDLCPPDQLGERSFTDHGAGWIRRRCDHQPIERAPTGGSLDRLGRRRPAIGGAHRNRDDVDPERHERVAVTRVTRLDDRHPVAWLEDGDKCQRECGRRPCDNTDSLRTDPVVTSGDGLTQLGDAQRRRVAEWTTERTAHRISHRRRWRGGRLADFEVQHLLSVGFEVDGAPGHLHCVERRDRRSARRCGDDWRVHVTQFARRCRSDHRRRCDVSIRWPGRSGN